MSDTVKKPTILIIAIALGAILNPLNTTMITVALPSIQQDFKLSSTDTSWLIASYFIVSAIFLPIIGRLSDYYGRKRIFLIGLLLVLISSILAPMSNSMMMLLSMRLIQAIGTSALYPAGIGMVRLYIKQNQNRVIGTLAVFATTSAAFGPTISGLLIQYGGWPVIFYVNLPVIFLSALLTWLYIPKDEPIKENTFKWDIVGMILFSAFMTSWMVFLLSLEGGFDGWSLILSIGLSILFYVYEKKKADPLINVVFLQKNPTISVIYAQYILATLIFFSILLFTPIYLQEVIELGSEYTGLMMLALSVFAMITTPIATRWAERAGYRVPLLIGAGIGIVGVVFLYMTTKNSSLPWIVLVLALFGISNGLINISLQNLLYTFIRVTQTGIASGLLMTSRFIGNILASSIYGVVFAIGLNDVSKNSMAIVLLAVSLIIIPGTFYVTNQKMKTEQW
ncbi:MFS transporter [Bacillus timonensis]|uniref:MFS transporter n=1 Tax=Bacillus timonensis TaxID=1033734 RepID=A0A4S3PLQ9_9BACI|nr:MFS transporter [Bacillus timonensis]THE10430.1 MFS transporter [Bacillus timonensis]